MPIVPMVLINGAEGIGTGWSTSIPNYNPREIVANIKRLMEDEPQVGLTGTKRDGLTDTICGLTGRLEPAMEM